MQFKLRTLLLLMLVLSVFFAYLAHYRPNRRTVAYESVLVPEAAMVSWCDNRTRLDNSPYSYKLLTKDELTELRNQLSSLGTSIIAEKRTIHMWPKQSVSDTGIVPFFLPIDDPLQGANPSKIPTDYSGNLNGFLGIRKAGLQIQLRVDVGTQLRKPEAKDVYSPQEMPKYEEVAGPLFYEGEAPENGLIFAAPIGEHSFHVVLFEVYAPT